MLRETFIALRARRTGHQIAREIVYPPLPVTSELEPVSSEKVLRERRCGFEPLSRAEWVTCVFLILMALGVLAFLVYVLAQRKWG